MPKKTKKEKLLAIQRRSRVSPVAIPEKADKRPSEGANPNTFSFSLSPTQHATPTKNRSADTDYRLMKKDLVKTVLITCAILISEVLLTRWLPQ